jgi:hypothetical protein
MALPSDTSWATLLHEAVHKPGLMLAAYQAFHNYSVGNQILAMVQCYQRDIPPGPLNTFPGWLRLNRHVRKGEKALSLCMPVTGKRRAEERATPSRGPASDAPDVEDAGTYTRFVYRPNWFALSQTEGEPYQLPPMPAWDKDRALSTLGIAEVSFALTSGNTQDYAQGRHIAINPVAQLPAKTTFHELAHIELGHTLGKSFQEEPTARHLREAEAESVALLLLDSLGLDGAAYCRGYIQHWLQGDSIPERSAQKIFAAADRILKAGSAAPEERQGG